MSSTNDLAYILRGKNRIKVLQALQGKTLISKQIEKTTNMYKSHVSRTIKELQQKRLIRCTNEKDRSFKFYKLTKDGEKILEETKQII